MPPVSTKMRGLRGQIRSLLSHIFRPGYNRLPSHLSDRFPSEACLTALTGSPLTNIEDSDDPTDIEDVEGPPIRGHDSIVDLLVELLSLIFESLPFPSKVCFALTSKRMYHLFGSILKDDRLVYPRMFSSTKFSIPLGRPDIPRNQVLLQLEDQRFAFCSSCLRLHPRDEFRRWELFVPPLKRECMVPVGTVNLCACLALTGRDRMKLKRWLEAGFLDVLKEDRLTRQFQMALHDDGQRHLVHHCVVTDNVDAFIRIKMIISRGDFADDDEMSLSVRATFSVHLCSPSPPPGTNPFLAFPQPAGDPLWLCMGLDIMRAIWFPEARKSCHSCGACVEKITRSDGGLLATVQCTHILGPRSSVLKPHRWPEASFFGHWYAPSGRRLASNF
ncbi:hypothetical protein BJX96DRAFT_72321 [Aspergillus floccosus]